MPARCRSSRPALPAVSWMLLPGNGMRHRKQPRGEVWGVCGVPGTGLTYARHALTANAAASVFVCSTLGNECSAPTQPTCRLRGQISGNVLLISVQPASRRGRGVRGVPGPGISRWSFTQSHSRCRCRRRRPMTPNFFIMYFALLLFIYHRCYSLIESLKVIRASAAAMTCKPVEGRVREAGLCLPYGVPLVASWHLTWQQQKREQKQLQGTVSGS